MVGTGGVNAMFVRDDLPELGTDLRAIQSKRTIWDFLLTFFRYAFQILSSFVRISGSRTNSSDFFVPFARGQTELELAKPTDENRLRIG